MLKRGYGATVEEWLMAAEYIVSSGNPNVILCERGIRTFETYTRNTMDLAAVPLLDQLTHLPVIVDPSHATGKRWLVKPLAIGGVAVGADGVMVEVHPNPDEALSDAEQQLDFDEFRDMMAAIIPVHEHVRGLYHAGRRGVNVPTASGPARRAVVAGQRPPARRAAAARRQVDQPSRAASWPRWPPARAGSRAPGTAPTCARPPASWPPSARPSSGRARTAATVDYRDRVARRRRPRARRRTSSTAATPGRACG